MARKRHPSAVDLSHAAVESKHFNWNPLTKTFSCEASDRLVQNRPLYDDAVDEGFAMRSSKTGKIVHFTESKVNRDREGDIVSWEYEPDVYDARLNPALAGVKVIVFND